MATQLPGINPIVGTLGSQTQNQQQQQATGASQQQNQYTQGQQALQGQIPGLFSSLVGGGLSTFTNPQPLLNQFNQAWNNYGAPQVAAQYGAGSPQIGSQYQQGLVNLLGNQYNQGISNYTNALNSAGGYGLAPVGLSGNTASATDANQFTQTQYGATLLNLLYQMALTSGLRGLSDKRLKKNIKPVKKKTALEQIKKLCSVVFNWRSSKMGTELQTGFIAQEVEQVIPEAVFTLDDDEQTRAINYIPIIATLVAAVQELTERLEKLENEKLNKEEALVP